MGRPELRAGSRGRWGLMSEPCHPPQSLPEGQGPAGIYIFTFFQGSEGSQVPPSRAVGPSLMGLAGWLTPPLSSWWQPGVDSSWAQ